MIILSPQWKMTVSVRAEYMATYIFQSKNRNLKMASLRMPFFLRSTNISCGQTHECFICKWIYQMFPFFLCVGIHVLSCRGRRRTCYRMRTVLQEQWRLSFICFRTMLFWAGTNLFKMSEEGNTHTLSAGKFSLMAEQFEKLVDFRA